MIAMNPWLYLLIQAVPLLWKCEKDFWGNKCKVINIYTQTIRRLGLLLFFKINFYSQDQQWTTYRRNVLIYRFIIYWLLQT